MTELVFLLEEESAKQMLEGLMPRILPPDVTVRYVVFDGKQDLEHQLVRRIRNYRRPDARFIVVRDQDADDCIRLKNKLVERCLDAGREQFLVRIACRELESWYLADLAAVERGLGLSGLVRRQRERKFRTPDLHGCPAEDLKNLTKGLYQKVGGSRAIGPHLDPENTRSPSFRALVTGVRRLCQ